MIPSSTSSASRLLGLVLAPCLFLVPPSHAGEMVVSEDQMEKLSRGEVVILDDPNQSSGDERMKVVAAIIIDQEADAVADVLNDTEAGPEYISDLKEAKLLEKGEGFQLVEQKLKISVLPLLTYVIRHENVSANRIEFERVSGDLKDVRGFWEFRPLNDGSSTLLIYSLEISPGIPVPGFLMKSSMKKTLPNALRGVRDYTNLLATEDQ